MIGRFFILGNFLIFISAFFVHAGSLYSYFFADDLSLIACLEKSAASPAAAFSLLLGSWQPENMQQFWRPLGTMSYMLDFFLWHGYPFGYHLSNLLIHSSASVLLYRLGQKLLPALKEEPGTANKIALVAALLFAVMPLHAEPVLWIVGRLDLLATAFALASLVFSPILTKKNNSLVFSLLLFMCSLLSKEVAAALPLMIFSLCFACQAELPGLKRWGASFKQAGPYFLTLLIWLILRWLVLGTFTGGYGGSIGETIAMTAANRIFTADIFWKLVFPFNEQIFSMSGAASSALHALYTAIGLYLVLAALYSPWSARRWQLFFLLCFYFVLAVLPVSSILHLSANLVGGRLLYFGSVFVALLFALVLWPEGKPALETDDRQANFFTLRLFMSILPVSLSLALLAAFSVFSFAGTQHWLIIGERIKRMQVALQELASKQPVIFIAFPRQQFGVHMLYSHEQLLALLSPPLVSSSPTYPVASLFPRQVCDYEGFNRTLFRLMHKRYPKAASVVVSQSTGQLITLDKALVKDLLAENRQSYDPDKVIFSAPEHDQLVPGCLHTVAKLPHAFSGCNVSFLSLQLSWPASEEPDGTNSIKPVKPLLADVEVSGWTCLFNTCDQTNIGCYLFMPASLIRISTGESLNWLGNGNIDSLQFALCLRQADVRNIKNACLSKLRLYGEFALKPLFYPEVAIPENNGLLQAQDSITFSYDVSSIAGAEGICLQVGKPLSQFVHYSGQLNGTSLSPGRAYKKIIAGQKGHFTIPVPADGQWRQASICAFGAGNLQGHFSDPLTFINSACISKQ